MTPMLTPASRRRQAGFTMIELIMVIVILAVAAAMIAGSFRGAIDMVRQQVAQANGATESRRILATMSEEFRMANSLGAFSVWTNRDCSFRTVRGDSVRFTWSGAAGAPLIARYNNVTDTLIRSVDSVGFSYSDSSNSTAASLATIDNVGIYLRLSTSGALYPMKSYVHIRN